MAHKQRVEQVDFHSTVPGSSPGCASNMNNCIGGEDCRCDDCVAEGFSGTEAKGEQPACLASKEGSSPSGPAIVGIATFEGRLWAIWSDGQVYCGYWGTDVKFHWNRLPDVPRNQ